jgi:hypothetical protein
MYGIAAGVLVFVVYFVGKHIIRKRWEEAKVRARELALMRQKAEARRAEQRARQIVKTYPVLELTQDDYDSIPTVTELIGKFGKGFERTAAIGTRMKWPQFSTVGIVVNSDDAFVDQVGGGVLGLGKTFVNRYQVRTVKPAGKQAEAAAVEG